jgi:hypothetical protein
MLVDYTRLENMSAVIHTHAVMCLYSRALPCSLFLNMYWHFAFCNNPVHAQSDRQQTAVIDYTRLENMSVIHTIRCDVSGTSGSPCLFPTCTGTLCILHNPVHAQVQQTADSCHRLYKARKHVSSHSYTCCDVSGTSGLPQPVSMMYWHLHSAITLCMQSDTTDSRQLSSIIQGSKHVSSHSYTL